RGPVKGSGNILLRGIFSEHGTGTSDGKEFQRISGPSFHRTQKSRSHPQRELCDNDTVFLCQKKMAQLVYENNRAEYDHSYNKFQSTTCFRSTCMSPALLPGSPPDPDALSFCVFP